MKTYLLLALLIILCSEMTFAQGGIGKMPREDIVMLRATVRDSLSDEVYNKVIQLKTYALNDMTDSATVLIVHNGGTTKEGRWARAVNMQAPEEAARATMLISKLKTMFTELPDMVKEYFAVFKDKDNPAGQNFFTKYHGRTGKQRR